MVEYSDDFKALSMGFAVCHATGIVPVVSHYRLGGVGCVLVNEESGIRYIEESKGALESLYPGIHLVNVKNAWSFMRRAAGEGLCGLILMESQWSESTQFIFMNRIEESGNDLPTILAVLDGKGSFRSLSRVGEIEYDHARLIHWERFDLTDPITAMWAVRLPFRDWDQGDPFYELKGDNLHLLITEHQLLGDWIGIDGGLPIFTSKDEAQHYLEQHVLTGNHRVHYYSEGVKAFPDEVSLRELAPYPIYDFADWIKQKNQVNPFLSICVNPDGHRENMAYVRDGEMVSVGGIWKILPDNHLEKLEGYGGWRGQDTIGWSHGQGIQLIPLSGSFAIQPSFNLTSSEAEESMKSSFVDSEGANRGPEANGLDDYYLVCWDSVTGESNFSPVVLPTYTDALKWLIRFEAENDRSDRASGAFFKDGAIGFDGTDDGNLEALRGSHFQNGIETLGINALLHGYSPSDSEHLVSLCNTTLRTLHIDFAGYAKDLLWQSNDQQLSDVLERIGIDPSIWSEWSESAEPNIDPKGQSIGIERMGSSSWNLLSDNAKHFISTVLASLDDSGHIPQRDYAPQSLEFVKALEVELTTIINAYRDSLPTIDLEFDPVKADEKSLHEYLHGSHAPTLGGISYLLRGVSLEGTPLHVSFANFIYGLPNSEFLTSNRFTKRDLPRVINKYRNGGVHDQPIMYGVCIQCMDDLIGTANREGMIAKVLAWRRSDSGEAII